MTNEELTARYVAGQSIEKLAAAAGMLQERLRRIGVPPRRRAERAPGLSAPNRSGPGRGPGPGPDRINPGPPEDSHPLGPPT